MLTRVRRVLTRYRVTTTLAAFALFAIMAGPALGSDGAVTDGGLQLRDVLSITGAVAGAAIITGLIQLLKGFGLEGREKAAALIFSLALVLVAFVDQNIYTLPAGFEAFLAWLAVAKGATGIYDEFTRKPSAITVDTA